MPEHATIARAIVMNDGKVLILQNAEDDPKEYARGKWESPGGFIEEHDGHRKDAVKREVKEETSIDVEVVEKLESISVTIDGDTSTAHYYLCHSDSQEIELSDEHQNYRWIEPGEARGVDWYYYSSYMIPVLERLAGELD